MESVQRDPLMKRLVAAQMVAVSPAEHQPSLLVQELIPSVSRGAALPP